ncbi:hypothetical protein ACP70R_005917 [Stipagrostis hirtigluma subsp. patula]
MNGGAADTFLHNARPTGRLRTAYTITSPADAGVRHRPPPPAAAASSKRARALHA